MARVMHLMTQLLVRALGSAAYSGSGDPSRFHERTAPLYLLAWVLSGERLNLLLTPCNIQVRRLKRAVAGKG